MEIQKDKIHIKYSYDGSAVPDHRAENLVIDLIEYYKMDGHSYFHVSTENVIQFMLTYIIKENLGMIVVFEYDGKLLVPNEYGALHDWPKGFCDLMHGTMTERLRMAVTKRKAKRENSSK